MRSSSKPIGLPRRVVTLYLLFSLLAVGSLMFGAYFATQAVLVNRTTGSALSQIGRIAAALKLDRVQTGGANASELLADLVASGQFLTGAIVDEHGVYLTHTDTGRVGAPADDPPGAEPFNWGSVQGLRFPGPTGGWIDEYRVPLATTGQPPHSLRLTHPEPRPLDTLAQCGQYAAIAILGPMVCIGLGVWFISRMVSPLSAIDRELVAIARLPRDHSPSPSTASQDGVAAIGWNRLVDHVERLTPVDDERDDLEIHLAGLMQADSGGRARDTLESLAEGVALTDVSGRIEFANRAIAALLNTDSAVEGTELLELVGALDEDTRDTLAEARCESAVAELPVAVGDESRVLRVARNPLRSGDSGGGHVWSVRDITQQKLAEASRDQFINTATHELRTPLANIKAYAETLVTCDFQDVEEQKQFCNTINDEATRLARFVDDLLSISSMEVGSLAIDRQKTNVMRLMEEAAEKVRTLMRGKSIDFDVQLGEKLGEALFDKDKVLGMVVNLLGNAAKYTPDSGTVTFTAVRQEDAIKIEVADTGVGIDEAEQPKVFEKFFRSENPAIRDEVGTGLGLPLAREIAELHRGELTLESTLGEGSVFTVILPVQ